MYKSKLNLRKMVAIAICLAGVTIFSGCDKDNANSSKDNGYPSLMIVNQYAASITSVSLVGYEFNTLSISTGQSQTFALDKGMPAGYKDINVSVTYRTSSYPGTTSSSTSKKFDFKNGETTTITLNGGWLD